MSSVEGYFPKGLSVVMESDSSFSKSLAIFTRLDRNVALFNPDLDFHPQRKGSYPVLLKAYLPQAWLARRFLADSSAVLWLIYPPLPGSLARHLSGWPDPLPFGLR